MIINGLNFKCKKCVHEVVFFAICITLNIFLFQINFLLFFSVNTVRLFKKKYVSQNINTANLLSKQLKIKIN